MTSIWRAAAALFTLAAGYPVLAQGSGASTSPACQAAGNDAAAVDLTISGFKDRTGRLRVQLYSDQPDEFLEKGAKLKRIDIPVTASGPMSVCVALPAPGTYAIAVLHDRNANHKLDVLNDGVGFSGNPRLALAKPKYQSVAFTVPRGVTRMNVVLNYRQGLAVRPIRR